jgi:hypothetical protein
VLCLDIRTRTEATKKKGRLNDMRTMRHIKIDKH